ncbi:hypothetical protein [Sphingobium yanoikuyae]|uniref:hypothetical protein n=1 Tax=Sphingobium yanoikuyae TaxID=13690 RepID=UPI0035C73AD5
MTEEEFRNGPARQRPLESFSDRPNEPTPSNPLGQSDRELEEARWLNAGMANREAIEHAYRVETTGQDGRSASITMRMGADASSATIVALPEEPMARIIMEPMLQFFDGGLEKGPAVISFRKLAEQIVMTLPRNPERTVALRKLLEARDCAMRALVMKS